ncbi:hypothetical protein EC587_28185 [Klebsiella quasipneumoniae subsp. quasipneumoniae]|nr:hypothetical protein CWN73_10540 [Klebsiella quasipneumoniae]TBP41339.1 hypothetical protein EXU05_17080 [Klebsiella quasipneumoniae subsp. quasipneumoniae]TBP65478.1 hypothetical protein EXT99_20810 [Klebsiella quasipneumoniae subsp. quasipneumoniae]TBQ01985.1 hypothetical protein EXU07_18005 [Klebsiella quasipneumoniae subsp. quasipneumoniae]TBQ64635.1 hypothetical protein EXU11_21620 [Klebsiella quasipneumoniae subsp. quasipneumoniae]
MAPDRPAALRLPGLGEISRSPLQKRRPDKAFMPPSGTTAGMELEVSCPAALRLPGLQGEPAGRNVGRIRHVCRHPA